MGANGKWLCSHRPCHAKDFFPVPPTLPSPTWCYQPKPGALAGSFSPSSSLHHHCFTHLCWSCIPEAAYLGHGVPLPALCSRRKTLCSEAALPRVPCAAQGTRGCDSLSETEPPGRGAPPLPLAVFPQLLLTPHAHTLQPRCSDQRQQALAAMRMDLSSLCTALPSPPHPLLPH